MAASFSNINLINGDVITLPFSVTGTVVKQNPATMILSLTSEIDDGDINDVSECTPVLPKDSTDFSLELTTGTPGTYYILTLVAMDDDLTSPPTTLSITFQIAQPAAITTIGTTAGSLTGGF